ncbi:MAG: STAS domain-containing protein [Acidimicrobiales bacterium]
METEPEPMASDVLVISSRRDGSRAVVVVGGELDLHGSERLTDEVKRVLTDAAGALDRVEIDARELTFADSAGLRAVLLARDEAQTTGASFAVTGVTASVERVIEMAGLTDVLLAD